MGSRINGQASLYFSVRRMINIKECEGITIPKTVEEHKSNTLKKFIFFLKRPETVNQT
jgi:hypothetical protein